MSLWRQRSHIWYGCDGYVGSKSRGLDSNTIVSKLSNNVKHHKELPEGGLHPPQQHLSGKILSQSPLWESLDFPLEKSGRESDILNPILESYNVDSIDGGALTYKVEKNAMIFYLDAEISDKFMSMMMYSTIS